MRTIPAPSFVPSPQKFNWGADVLRIHLKKGEAGLEQDSDIIVDQIRSIDNRRFLDHLGVISDKNKRLLLSSLRIVILE
ncbi:MAG: type II toxin-antitoxin system PemK/MazF family toxin [Deltaproteobacteria bacterium]|nr:type II toxin-antitoxin system PemK/MazF family toxin [Deltaproteobacteria bacterium]